MSERPNSGDPLDANRDVGFIPQIFSYCDRWCERCAFTLRCRVYAMETDLADAGSDLEEPVEEGGAENLADLAEGDEGAWPEELEDSDFREPVHDLKTDPEDLREGPHGLQETEANLREQAAHERGGSVVQSAEAYAWRVKAFMDDHPELADEDIAELVQILSLRETHPADIKGCVVHMADALESILWYPFVMTSKLRRAFLSQVDEILDESQHGYRDSEGSAKVTLLAIERSLAAWEILETLLPLHADFAKDCQARLRRLLRNVEEQFPQARAFVRPGFDE